jgi:hypothetical protein
VIAAVEEDPLRSMFDEYGVEFPDHRRHPLFDFQLVKDTSAWKTATARLTFDSRIQETPGRLRGSAPRQLLLQASDLDVHLAVTEAGVRTSLMGQVLLGATSRLLSGIEVRLLEGVTPLDVETTNDLGEFRFSSVPKGEVSLEILRSDLFRIVGTFSV